MQATATRAIPLLVPSTRLEACQPAAKGTAGSRTLRVCAVVSRVLLGLSFFVFGLDGFLHFFPMPAPSEIPAAAAALGGALAATGYMFPLIKGTEVR